MVEVDMKRVSLIIKSLIEARYNDVRKYDDKLDLRAPLCPLFAINNGKVGDRSNDKFNISKEIIATRELVPNLLCELSELHYKWALDNYINVRNCEKNEKTNKSGYIDIEREIDFINERKENVMLEFKKKELSYTKLSPYLNYLSSQYDGVDSPVISEIIFDKQCQIVLEHILLTLNQQNSMECRTERFKKHSSIMLLLGDLLRAMSRKKQINYNTMDFHVLIDILFREMVIMRDLGFALFEYVSCLNIVIKCISSTKEKYRWGEATTLLSVTESLIEGFDVAAT
ncbi:hypothetical protein FG379_001249 [Cryptosporidium bovis]|uniref:uncharacterized protein n=1 Tax=Cryptosporidium bovis TaxID=310047 RepID=UPI00351A652E|nr:hypothetical protein FG379_001249 [Cryptosporidium bovis]